jgi:dienelactone hydrolase
MTPAKQALSVAAALVLAQSLHMAVAAQQGAQPAPLSPAPPTGVGKDAQGRLLPYGVPAYFTPDTPLGTGRFKAIMATDPSLPEHVLYYPKDLAAAGRMPIVVWANGSCMHAGNRSRGFLTEIASHGFLVISAGRMGHVGLEVGAQENPFVARPGGPPAPPAAPPVENDPTEPLRSTRSTVDHMRQAIDWAIAQNGRQGSPFFNRLDVAQIGAGGQSCGGGLTTTLAADPRLKTIGIFHSGTRLVSAPGREIGAEQAAEGRRRLNGIHTPTIIITGDEVLDIAYSGGHDTFNYLKVPVFHAWQENLGHVGTYGLPNGGSLGRIASAWYAWQLRADRQAGRMFTGSDCTLCREPTWHVQKKNID